MPDDAGLVVLRTYQTVIEAEVAKSSLDSVGIDSIIRSDKGEQSPGASSGRGVELLVKPMDVDLAADILNVEGMEGP